MGSGNIGMNVHNTKNVRVAARDIGYFWTINFTATDENGGVFSVDYYVHTFDAEAMESLASSLAAGAKSIRELAKKKAKQARCGDCGGKGTVACVACKGDEA